MKERRIYKRYLSSSRFSVDIKEKKFDARTTDYSLDGLGLLVDDHPAVTEGDVVGIRLDRPPFSEKAKVMWKKSLNSMTKLGLHFERPIKGSLDDFQISDIIIGLQRTFRTGVLEIFSGDALKKTYLKNGDMVFASSNLPEDSFAGVLLRDGKIDREKFDTIVRLHSSSGKKQGTLLVEQGFIKPAELFELLRHRVEEIILSVFTFEKGEFFFREGPLPSEETVNLKLSAAQLIYKGLKRINDLGRLRKECPDGNMIVGLSSNPLDLFQEITIEESDKKILMLLDGKSPLKDILSISPLSEMETLKAVYAFLGTRIVEVKESTSEQEFTAEEVLEKKKTTPKTLIKNINEMFDKCRKLNHFELLGLSRDATDGKLGLSRTATDGEVKKAYYRLAKEFHPDLHFNLDDDVKAKLTYIFSSITEAYGTLKTSDGRSSYLKSLEKPSVSTLGTEVARKRFKDALAFLEKGNIKEAEALFAEAAYLDGSSSEYRYYYGVALGRQNKHREAEKELKRAQQKDPENPDILAELGHVYLKLGFPTRAQGNFERALKKNPTHQRASYGIKIMKDSF